MTTLDSLPLRLLPPLSSPAALPNLPGELIHAILLYVLPPEDRLELVPEPPQRSPKHGLSRISLVCKEWCGFSRPLLFRYLHLRSTDDLLSLQQLVTSSKPIGPALSDIIGEVQIRHSAVSTTPWLVHLHWLASRLPRTTFICTLANSVEAPLPPDDYHCAPFRALPSLPPSYLRLSELHLQGLLFKSLAELKRLLSSLSSLHTLSCRGLTFVDPSPITRFRSAQQARVQQCEMWDCLGPSLYALAAFACSTLGAQEEWGKVVKALAGLVPDDSPFYGVAVRDATEDTGRPCFHLSLSGPSLLDSGPPVDEIGATVFIARPVEHRDVAPVGELALRLDTRGRTAGAKALQWDALLPIMNSPSFCVLSFVITRRSPDEAAFLAIVQQQAHLYSAIESGKVQLKFYQGFIPHHAPGG